MKRADITWELLPAARTVADARRARLGHAAYEADKAALQDFLCGYFASGDCRERQGNSIAPMRSPISGAKCLKVRWLGVGEGKSGGLRLAIVALCERRIVRVADAFERRDEPSDAAMDAAFRSAKR